jgi:triosephosphate isomerase (TIM)
MKQRIIIGNWKMNPVTPKEAKKLITTIVKSLVGQKGVEVVVCPPSIFVSEVAIELKKSKVHLGVQDLFYETKGAYTGQTSPDMVKAYKVQYAILGHSERRELGETNELVGQKVRFAIRQGLTAVLCVGERERNDEGTHYTFVRDELEAVFQGLKRAELAKLIIAYEPIWAIGKSADEAMQTRELYEMTLYIRKLLIERFGRTSADQVSVLYGGSVKPENATSFILEGGVDGLLVGGASLDSKQFISIITAVKSA